MRPIMVCEKPVAPATERFDQCAASTDVERSVHSITVASWSSWIVHGQPVKPRPEVPRNNLALNRQRIEE